MKTETYTSSRQWFYKIIHTDRPEGNWKILFFFLYLFSLVYYLMIRLWLFLYAAKILKTRRLPRRVISIGNLTVGGTGKTPMVLALSKFFRNHGLKVAVLSRGYGRANKNSILVVSDGARLLATPALAGEEAYFLAQELEGVIVAVGKNRYRTGMFLLKNYKIDLFILDDGFQHLRLHRDTNILLIDSSQVLSTPFLFPRGELREPLSSITRASLIVLSSKDENGYPVNGSYGLGKISHIPIFSVSLIPKCFFNMLTGETYSPEQLKGKSSLIVSGIGNPKSFKKLVEKSGIQIIRELVFPDHHPYRHHDIEAIYDIACSRKVDFIITTDKDAVKIRPYLKKELPVLILKLEFKAGEDFPWEDLKTGVL